VKQLHATNSGNQENNKQKYIDQTQYLEVLQDVFTLMHVNVLPSSYRSRTEPGNVLFACFEALYLNI